MKELISIFLSLVLFLPGISGTRSIRIIDIESSTTPMQHRITITADSPLNEYSPVVLDDPAIVGVDIHNAVLEVKTKENEVSGNYVYKIRWAQNNRNPDITRVVADLKDWTDYKISLSPDKKRLYIDFDNDPTEIYTVNFSKPIDADLLELDMKYGKTPVISDGSSNNQLVVDFPMAKFRQNESFRSLNGRYISSVEGFQLNSSTARLIVGLKSPCLVETLRRKDGAAIEITSLNSKGICYSNQRNPVFTINSERVGYNYFNYRRKKDGKELILSVPSKTLPVGAGKMFVNDSRFDAIDILKDDDSRMTNIVFTARKPVDFITDSVKDNEKLTVSAVQPEPAKTTFHAKDLKSKVKDQLVVIDPGHGGSEMGAIYPDGIKDPALAQVKEKEINLDISLRLAELLKQAGVNIRLTRQDDRTVGLVDRAEMANRLNASLFVSVHSNSGEQGENGSMTLFYPSVYDPVYKITGERAAQIMQEEMISILGTKDRGLWKRPRLAVLNNTKMPAILAEVAYISDDSDRNKLTDNLFRKKAAEALCKGIIKTLNEMASAESIQAKDQSGSSKSVSNTVAGIEDKKPGNINGFIIPAKLTAKCEYQGNRPEQSSLFDLRIVLDFAKEKSGTATLEEQRMEAEKVLLSRMDEAAVKKIMGILNGLKDYNTYFWEEDIENENYKVWVRCLRNTGKASLDIIHK